MFDLEHFNSLYATVFIVLLDDGYRRTNRKFHNAGGFLE